MPSVLPQPPLEPRAYFLQPPAPPALPDPQAPARIYTAEQLEMARWEARQDGMREAQAMFEQVRQKLEAESNAAVEQFVQTAQALLAERQALLLEASEGVVDLALRVAERVLRRQVELDPDAAAPVVRELLQRAATAESLTVRLSPRDHARITARLESMPEAAGIDGLRWRADAGITPGGCVIETEAGSLDGRIETQLERIAQSVQGREEGA